jgi:D-lactate dehydrogenase
MNRHEAFLAELRSVVGKAHVLTSPDRTRRYRTGFRAGAGPALAVVRPGSLLELWHVLKGCTAESKVMILQASNTGLTGGSTPVVSGYDRDAVIINTLRISRVYPIDGGGQVICLAGTTLQQLEAALVPFGREPHSVLGSTCFGASVVGGVCNNSGGASVQRGPAYTEMTLFAQVLETGELKLVNHLGVRLSGNPEQALVNLERGVFECEPLASPRRGSDDSYIPRIRDINSHQPTRYNEDTHRLFEASGCAGKVAVFAVRIDTFPKAKQTRLFYIGTNRPEVLTRLRRQILTSFDNLPVAAEYMHRTAFEMAELYGKEIFLAIRMLGTRWLSLARSMQARADAIRGRIGWGIRGSSGRLFNGFARILPKHLPHRMRDFRDRFEHHLLLKMADDGIEEARQSLLGSLSPCDGEVFECSEVEAGKALLHRFVVAGAARRFLEMQQLGARDIVNLDVALRPGDCDWSAFLPETVKSDVYAVLCYGHFLCHVFHMDYLIRCSGDAGLVTERLKAWLDARGARYPAEHNVGHMYKAGAELVAFYHSLDPTNSFNPGVGQTSTKAHWQ